MKNTKTILSLASILVALAVMTIPLKAVTYTGTGNANGGGAADGGGISSVDIFNDASTITFTINSTQPMASWIFFTVQIQKVGAPTGYTGFANPWGPQIGVSSGTHALINTWGTGATPFTFDGANWVEGTGQSYDAGGTGSTFATVTLALSSLGLSVGDSFHFDVVSSYTSPTGQSAYGALFNTSWPAESDNAYTPWNGTSYYDSATDAGGTLFGTSASLYTVIPEPATITLLAAGFGLLMMQNRRIRR
ncbi:MAG TPA: hypothetical protein PKA41_13510 [Verrucomicrobiota bacterium]|nr:hypothetical protein [Verrucomicrobiota bacterium]